MYVINIYLYNELFRLIQNHSTVRGYCNVIMHDCFSIVIWEEGVPAALRNG